MIHAQKAVAQMPTIARMCTLLGVSRSGYYKWVTTLLARAAGTLSGRAARNADLVVKIRVAHDASDQVNGSPRITADLRAAGEVVSRKTVAKLMRQNGIRGISPRPWTPPTTISGDGPCVIPDLVARRFDRGELNKVWTSDITYLATGAGWLYLCAVRDGCSRRVLGYAFSDSLHTDVVEQALRRAVLFGDPSLVSEGSVHDRVIFHADRGCQYTSAQLASVAKEVGVRLSVGRTGVCYDNAQQESFWSTLKTEYYQRHSFTTHREAILGVSNWIENTYNRSRRHSSLAMISPITFERQLITTANQAA